MDPLLKLYADPISYPFAEELHSKYKDDRIAIRKGEPGDKSFNKIRALVKADVAGEEGTLFACRIDNPDEPKRVLCFQGSELKEPEIPAIAQMESFLFSSNKYHQTMCSLESYKGHPVAFCFVGSVVVSKDTLDLLSKYFSYIYKNARDSGQIIYSLPVNREWVKKLEPDALEKYFGKVTAEATYELSKKILDTPDETDKFLPKIDFNLTSCNMLFDTYTCYSVLLHKITKAVEKTNLENTGLYYKYDVKTNEAIRLILEEETYVLKLEDGFCIVDSMKPKDEPYDVGSNILVRCVVSRDR